MFQYYIGTLDAICDMCPCKFATTTQLPCCHVLVVSEKKGTCFIVFREWCSKQMEKSVHAGGV